jgi:hypothetical protein
MSETDGFKLEGEHVEGCLAAARPPAFILHDDYEWRRDKNGRRHRGGGMWHRFSCNDMNCDAVMLVRWDVLAEFIDPSERP